jgi:hypothetical protein
MNRNCSAQKNNLPKIKHIEERNQDDSVHLGTVETIDRTLIDEAVDVVAYRHR